LLNIRSSVRVAAEDVIAAMGVKRLPIERPIFMVGCGRSGTTVLYESLCAHPQLAWFSNYTERWPRLPQLALLSHLRRSQRVRRSSSRFVPRPTEGYPLWDFCGGRSPARNAPLSEADAAETEAECLRNLITDHLRYQRATRFVNKNTRNSRRIRYLSGMFPDAVFIHVLRDPRATAASLVRVSWWRDLPLWWSDGRTPRQLTALGETDAVLAAKHWRFVVERLLADSGTLSSGHYLEIRYEEFIDAPTDVLAHILEFCALPWSDRVAKAANDRPLTSMNNKFREQFAPTELGAMSEIFGPLAGKLGYQVVEEESPERTVEPPPG
jgi:omega-hydroxy-beta-dihydromenaquinone-9 sulfotransferase